MPAKHSHLTAAYLAWCADKGHHAPAQSVLVSFVACTGRPSADVNAIADELNMGCRIPPTCDASVDALLAEMLRAPDYTLVLDDRPLTADELTALRFLCAGDLVCAATLRGGSIGDWRLTDDGIKVAKGQLL